MCPITRSRRRWTISSTVSCRTQESHCNLEDAIKTHEVVFAAQECYRTGRPVKLPLLVP